MMKSITTLLACAMIVLGLAFQSQAQNEAEKEESTATSQQITLEIDGMACSMCEQNCKKSLEKLEGVKVEEISASEGFAKLIYTGSEPINDKTLKEAVENAGYKLKKIQRTNTNGSDVKTNQ